MHAAQLGMPISVIFVNNAIYGMTGGQLAPTTLDAARRPPPARTGATADGQAAQDGRADRAARRAGLRGAGRALRRQAARRARRRPSRRPCSIQVENKGFAFVEVLAECPTHLRMTPQEAETWVREKMLPVFPLGVKKDAVAESWGTWRTAHRSTARPSSTSIGAVAAPPPRFARLDLRIADRRGRAQAGGRRRRRRPDRRASRRARRHQRGARRDAHPELRPGVARRDLLRRRAASPGPRCSPPTSPPPTCSSRSTRPAWPSSRRTWQRAGS